MVDVHVLHRVSRVQPAGVDLEPFNQARIDGPVRHELSDLGIVHVDASIPWPFLSALRMRSAVSLTSRQASALTGARPSFVDAMPENKLDTRSWSNITSE